MSSQSIQPVATSPATEWIECSDGMNSEFLSPNEEFWYAVLVGRCPGVFFRGHSLGANLHRIPGALVIRCLSEDEALTEFKTAVEDGIAYRVDLVERSRTVDVSALDALPMGELSDLRPPSHRWYSVVVGRFPGVYNGPSGLAANMTGVSGAKAIKFMTKSEAITHFISALESGLVIQCIYDIDRVPVTSVVDSRSMDV